MGVVCKQEKNKVTAIKSYFFLKVSFHRTGTTFKNQSTPYEIIICRFFICVLKFFYFQRQFRLIVNTCLDEFYSIKEKHLSILDDIVRVWKDLIIDDKNWEIIRVILKPLIKKQNTKLTFWDIETLICICNLHFHLCIFAYLVAKSIYETAVWHKLRFIVFYVYFFKVEYV